MFHGSKRLVCLLAALILAGCAAGGRTRMRDPGPVSTLGRFDGEMDLKPIGGNAQAYSGLQGKKRSIFYLSAACPHCRTIIPEIKETRKYLDSLGYAAVNIAIKYNSPEQVEKFIEETGLEGFHYQDPDRRFGNKYGVGWIPLFIVVDENGNATRFNHPNDSLDILVKGKLLASCCKD